MFSAGRAGRTDGNSLRLLWRTQNLTICTFGAQRNDCRERAASKCFSECFSVLERQFVAFAWIVGLKTGISEQALRARLQA